MKKNCILLLLVGITALALAPRTRADARIEKELKLDPGGRFILDSDVGSVTITGSPARGAKVVITSDRDDLESFIRFSFDESPGTVRVTARRTRGFGWPRHVSLHYDVQVPAETQAQLKTAGGSIKAFGLRADSALNTSGGSIEVSGLVGRLAANTSGGRITAREVTGDATLETSGGGIEVVALEGSLRAHTSGGPIRASRVTREIDASTSGGSIHIGAAGGRVVARTSGGSVEVTFDEGNARGGELETSGGSIRVGLDPAVSLNLDASASGGRVTTNLPLKVVGQISSSSLHGTLGAGGELLRLHTSGGSVQIEPR